MNERAHFPRPTRPVRGLLEWLAAALALLAVGCPEPGDLEKVNSYCKPGQSIVGANNEVTGCSDTPSGSSGSGNSGSSCETACITMLFSNTCVSCHTQAVPLGELDLQSAGVAARLKDQPAKHAALDNPQGCPTGDKLIDSANPTASWLLKKVAMQQGGCGTQMPPQGATAADVTCVTEYVNCVSAMP